MKVPFFDILTKAWVKSFPLLPRVRRSFEGLLLFCILFFLINISQENITIPVKPLDNGHSLNQPVLNTYAAGVVKAGGQFVISKPAFIDRMLLSNLTVDIDMITLFCLALASIIIIRMVPKLQQQQVFKKDISNHIRSLGWLMIFHALSNVYISLFFTPLRIEVLTNKEFTSFHYTFPIFVYAEMYFALLVLAFASVYKHGVKLQEEQDLII